MKLLHERPEKKTGLALMVLSNWKRVVESRGRLPEVDHMPHFCDCFLLTPLLKTSQLALEIRDLIENATLA